MIEIRNTQMNLQMNQISEINNPLEIDMPLYKPKNYRGINNAAKGNDFTIKVVGIPLKLLADYVDYLALHANV